jgi:hypothetical protein
MNKDSLLLEMAYDQTKAITVSKEAEKSIIHQFRDIKPITVDGQQVDHVWDDLKDPSFKSWKAILSRNHYPMTPEKVQFRDSPMEFKYTGRANFILTCERLPDNKGFQIINLEFDKFPEFYIWEVGGGRGKTPGLFTKIDKDGDLGVLATGSSLKDTYGPGTQSKELPPVKIQIIKEKAAYNSINEWMNKYVLPYKI